MDDIDSSLQHTAAKTGRYRFPATLIMIAALTVLVLPCRDAVAEDRLIVLGYHLPALKGYTVKTTEQKKQHVHRTSKRGRVFDYNLPYDKEVTYERTLEGCTVSLSFEAIVSDQTVKRSSAVNGVRAGKQIAASMDYVLHQKPPRSLSHTEGDRVFDGMPGYYTTSAESFPGKDNIATQSEDRHWYFWKGTHLYTARLSITGPRIPPAVKSVAEKDWNILLRALQNRSPR